MADTYLDSSVVGFNHQDALDLKVDTYKRLAPILNMEDSPAIDENFANNLSILNDGPSEKVPDIPKISLGDALESTDPTIKGYALDTLDKQALKDPRYKYGLGQSVESPYNDYAKKFITKEFGYSALRDNEDFYYRNQYMQDGWFMRNLIKNPAKFIGRVIPQAVLKLGEGLGYVGSMITSIGSDNYWADVADNAFSRYLENAEQQFKDQVIPIYKQAGFDDKGFFKKLVDWSYWNDEIADGVAFFASALVPGTGFAKLGKLGTFGRAFSATAKLGKLASGVGMGSWAELSSWTFNTAMEASMEGAGVFKEVKRRLEESRARGENQFSDDEIRERAGKMAANTIAGNFAVLGLSNAWENTLLFKPFKNVEGKAATQLTGNFSGSSRALDALDAGGVKSTFGSLGRTTFYGKQALKGILAEGLWEENAQLAIQRINQGDNDGRNFLQQISKQTIDAFSGKDKEAAENIGLGALIGAGAGLIFSKLANERRNVIQNTRDAVNYINIARQNLFDANDIYERDKDNNLVFDDQTKQPKIDKAKLVAKQKAYESEYGKITLSNDDEYFQSEPVKFETKRALANYVRSLYNIGVKDISGRLSAITPENAALFGMNPKDIKKQAADYASLSKNFEDIAEDVASIRPPLRPMDMSEKDFSLANEGRKSEIYKRRSDNIILSDMVRDNQSKMLAELNSFRNLQNASLAQFPVDQLNTFIQQQKANKQFIDSEDFKQLSEIEKDYHKERADELAEQIDQYKALNQLTLQDSEVTENGFYRPLITDSNGNKKPGKFSVKAGLLSKNIANLSNEIHKNNYFDALLSDNKEGFNNYQKLGDTPLERIFQKAVEATKKTPSKYRELKQGDFNKVTDLVAKMVFGENQEYSPEELQLQQNYAKLIEEILPQYENAVDSQRVKNLNARLTLMRKEQEILSSFIQTTTKETEDQKFNLEYLKLTLEDQENQKKSTQRSIYKAINELEKKIEVAEKKIDEEQEKLSLLNEDINLLEQEVQGGSFRGLYGALQELKQEREWIAQKIGESRDLLGKVKGLLKSLLSVARQIFPSFDYKFLDRLFTDEYYGPQNKLNYDEERVKAYEEIKIQADKQTNLTNLINELTKVQEEMTERFKSNKLEIESILKSVNQSFRDAYIDLSKKAPTKTDPTKQAITDGLTADKGLFPGGINSGGGTFAPEEGFDGNTYQRPLATKFFTTTFPDYRGRNIRDLPQDVQDYFDFVELLSNPENGDTITKKLGKNADLFVLVVTKNNVSKLGLDEVLSDRKDSTGKSYFDRESPSDTHIEIIPVIEDGGYFYYTDKNLNKLGRVDENKPAKNIVRTVLRLPRFTQEEQDQYSVKHSEEAMAQAVKVATDWRKQLLDQTEKDAITTFDFTITRGIANKLEVEGGGLASNPVSTILPENKINGQSVRVYATENVTINDENIVVPIGRPFIYTDSGVYQQLHAADNRILAPSQIATINKVLTNMLTDHILRVLKIVDTNPKLAKIKERIAAVGGEVSNLTQEEKTALYLEATKNKPALYNSNYTNWLSSILYFNKLEKDTAGKYKVPGKNQIYMDGFMLVLGDSGFAIDMTNPADINSPEVQTFLQAQYHNIKYFPDVARANKEYVEYYLDGEELKNRTWKTYSHYLLSTKTPDGKARQDIPVTTSIKTKEQHNLEKGNDPYYTYLSRGLIVESDAIPAIKKKEVVQKGTSKPTTKETPEKNIKKTVSDTGKKESLAAHLAKKRGTKEVEITESTETNTSKGSLREHLAAKRSGKTENQGTSKTPNQDIPNYEQDNGADSIPSEGMFRLAKGGIFQTEDDLDGLIAEIGRMLPQFPVNRLRQAIRLTNGAVAWGEFTGKMINLYERAEKGTGYHEVFEAVVNKLLTDAEWNAIYKEFKSRKGSFTDRESGETIPYKNANPHQAKEEMAEEFMSFKLNGTLPSQKQTRSFFQIIIDFIKKYILGKETIDSIFTKIDKEKFAQTPIREDNRFGSNYRLALPELKAEVKADIMDGMSAFMFEQIFLSPESLTQLDEIDLNDEEIYEPIKVKFQKTVDGLKIRRENEKKKSIADQKLIRDYSNSIKYLQYTLDNWRDAVNAHKEKIESFRIKFEEQEETEQQKELKNRNDYTGNEFTTSGKKSASKSVRFLFGTLLQMNFAQTDGKGSVLKVNDRQAGLTKPYLNSVFLNKVVDYDRYMLEALEQFSGMSNFSQIEGKLRDLAGITEIEEMQNPDRQAELIAGLSDEKAVWTSLYRRVFGFSQYINPEATWNLKSKVQIYLAKHAPEPYLFLIGGGDSRIISATKRSFVESISRKIESSIIAQSSLIFSRKKIGGVSKYVPISKFKKEVKFDDFSDKEITKFVEYIGLDDVITKDFVSSLTKGEKNELKSRLLKIRNAFGQVETTSLNLRGLNIFGYVAGDNGLINFLDQKKNISNKEMQYLDHHNNLRNRHITPSFISRIIGDINNLSREELLIKYPHLDSYFSEDSIVLEKLYNEGGSRSAYKLGLGYMSAIKDFNENEGDGIAQLEGWDKYWIQFNATLKGLYYSLPADSETEWVFSMGEFVPYSENLLEERGKDIVQRLFIPKLRSEINTALNYSGDLLQMNGKHQSTVGRIGDSLRFFKDILKSDQKLVDEIHAEIAANTTADKIITDRKYKGRIEKAILAYLNSEVEQTLNTLKEFRLYKEDGDNFLLPAIEGSFVESYKLRSDAGVTIVNRTQLESIVQYQKINSIIGHMEQFKLFYGDPAQYKDWEKRAKSLFGPIEQTFYDETGEFNNWLTENKNSAILGDEKASLPTNDWFRKTYTDKIKSRTVNDFTVTNVETANSLYALQSDFANKFVGDYENTNETDGQSVGTLLFGRELMIKSGWRWTKEHENYLQYDTALMRQELSKLKSTDPHFYDYQGNNKLKDLDKKIVDFYKKNPPTYPLTPVKTLMPSVDENGNQILLKHSVYFISYQVAKEFEMLDTYIDMLKRGDDLLNFKSAQKVGLLLDNEGKVTDYYSDPFTKNNLEDKGNPQFEIDYRTIGIQVETQTSGKNQTFGTQLSKDINLNLFEDGIPKDFKGDREEWDSMDEEDRLAQSHFYSLVYGDNGTVRSLESLKIKNTLETFSKLGIRWNYSPSTGLVYDVADLTKVEQYIKTEMKRLKIDENALENIQLTDDKKKFVNPAETLPSYTTISNKLWALADKSVTSMSVNGKPFIQVSSAFFNKKSRQAAYFDKEQKNWITVDNKADYDKLKSEGKKLVMSSSELKFYRKGEDGEVLGMEVYLPHIYKQRVNEKREKLKLPPLTDEELMAHLNKNPELLQGVGFRIPTQATSSLEFFTIKGFLPEAFGNAVVVPSGITTKAGSDFDVDKLNTYLNNWKLDNKGLPFYEEFLDNSNSTVEKRYDVVYGKKRKFLKKLDEYLLKNYEKEILSTVDSKAISNLMDTIFGQVDDISFYNTEEIQDVLLDSGIYSNITYEQFLEKVREEELNSPTLEEFKQLPISLQNTKGALENRYFKSIRNVLSLPEMFEYLLSPNSISHVKENRDIVQKAINPDWQAEENKELDYTRFLSTEYIANKRNQFTKGKYDIGIFAVAMTNYANSQITGIGLSTLGGFKTIGTDDNMVFSILNEGYLDLPFSDIPYQYKNGQLFIPLSVLKDKDGKLTMDKISSYINGAVDVAKEPYIIEMGMHSEVAGVYIMMERMGLTGKTTALFLYQPAIREFLKELLFLENKSYFGFSTAGVFKKDIIGTLLAKYQDEGVEYDPNFRFDDGKMAAMITKGEKVKKGEATWTADEKRMQYLALVNYLKLKMYSNHLLENIMASNHDTASIRSSDVIMKKDLQLERSKMGNMVVRIEDEEVTNGADAIRNGTFVKTDISLLKNFNSLFSRIDLFALQKANPQKALIKAGSRMFYQNPYITDDDFIRNISDFKAAMIDDMVNNNLIVGTSLVNGKEVERETPLHQFAEQFFKTGRPGNLRDMYDHLYNMREDGKYTYRDYMDNNYFLQNLNIFIDKVAGIDLMELKKKPSNDDVLTKERITEGLRSMSQLDEKDFPDMIKFFKAIVYASYIQFGIKFSRKSFMDLIPTEAVTQLTKPALAGIDGYDFSTIDEQVQRSLWHRKGIVSEQMQRSVHFISPNPANTSEMKLEEKAKWIDRPKFAPTKISQTFFATGDENGELVPHIHPIFVWGGYVETNPRRWEDMPNIISIPAIKPEYMVRREAVVPYENEDGSTGERTIVAIFPNKTEIDAMRKRGDYSYIFYQLFKKVGVEDSSLGRKMISGGKKKSVNYLYKPINKYGNRDFNEKKPLLVTPNGTTLGEPSIINNPPFKEWEDNELISVINNTNGKIQAVIQPKTGTVTKTLAVKGATEATARKTITMQPDNIAKIENGTKTTTIRSINEAARIKIKAGQTEKRFIGDKEYNVTNRGYLTVEQAGGQAAMLKSEGYTDPSQFKYKQSRDWYNGIGKLYVYDIKKIEPPSSLGDDINNLPKCK